MIYILIVFYTISGHVYIQEHDQPSFEECTRQKQIWLHDAKRLKLQEPLAYCVGRAERPE